MPRTTVLSLFVVAAALELLGMLTLIGDPVPVVLAALAVVATTVGIAVLHRAVLAPLDRGLAQAWRLSAGDLAAAPTDTIGAAAADALSAALDTATAQVRGALRDVVDSAGSLDGTAAAVARTWR